MQIVSLDTGYKLLELGYQGYRTGIVVEDGIDTGARRQTLNDMLDWLESEECIWTLHSYPVKAISIVYKNKTYMLSGETIMESVVKAVECVLRLKYAIK